MLYAFGSNGAGQLGIGHTEDVSSPEPVVYSDDPQAALKKIVAGGNHTLFLYEDNSVRGSGYNEDGRTGIHSCSSIVRPERVVLLDQASSAVDGFYDVAATWSASFLVATDRRKVYMCGSGEHGELGLGAGITKAAQPGMIELPDTIESISACLYHTVVVLTSGEVWAWGQGRKGQLGEPYEEWWSPRKMESLPFRVSRALCGANFTCILGSKETGRAFILGLSPKDRFGLRSGSPATVLGWTDATASWGSLFVLKDSELVAWGRNDRGQLPPKDLPTIKRIAAGSEHWLILTNDSQILTGGWGEHGNCGKPTDGFGVVKGRYNVVSAGQPVKNVFAGCATSFFEVG